MSMPQPNQFGAPGYPPNPGQQPPYPQQVGPYPVHQAPYPQMDGFNQQSAYPQQQGGYPQQPGPYPSGYPQQGQFDYGQQPNYSFGQPTAPPPYGQEPQYYPQQQQPIMQQPMMSQQPAQVQIIQQGAVGANPQVMTCPNCREMVTSKVESSPTSSTHMTACLLGLIGWFCCCCIVPYCMDSCQAQKHTCPKCGNYLGIKLILILEYDFIELNLKFFR